MNSVDKERIINQLYHLIDKGGRSKFETHEEESIEYFHFFHEVKLFLIKNNVRSDNVMEGYIDELPRLRKKDFKNFELDSLFFFQTIISLIFFPYLIYWLISLLHSRSRKHKDIDRINIVLNKIINYLGSP